MAFTILTGELSHETNAFSIRKADLQAFRDRYIVEGEAAIAARGDANTGLAGFLDVAKAHGDRIIHTVSAAAEPSGTVTREAFETLAGKIVDGARRHKEEIDGVLLALHGAMVTEVSPDGEGELLARLREVLGDKIPIGITLDLHANVTEAMCRHANVIVSFKTYPHVDMRIAGRQAAETVRRAMAGEIRPRTIRVHLPMLEETNSCRTDIGPMIEWVKEAREYEKQPDVFAVSINAGFAHAMIPEMGPTVLVTCEGDEGKHRRFATAMARKLWEARHEHLNHYFGAAEAASLAKGWETGGKGPLVIADYADNPGTGSYGDTTALLGALIAADVRDACFGPMVDPEAVAILQRAKPGDRVRLKLGGKTDPTIGGAPLDVEATLLGLYDGWYTGDGPMINGLRLSYGPTATIRVGGIEILVVSVPSQMRDLQQFLAFGIDPRTKRVVGLKSAQHFRAAFEPIASRVIVADAGGIGTSDLFSLPFKGIPRPIFPLDPETTWQPRT